MYTDFMGRCGDEIFNQMAKWQATSAGILKMPVVTPSAQRLQGAAAALRTGSPWLPICPA